jgi:hypothetical protein
LETGPAGRSRGEIIRSMLIEIHPRLVATSVYWPAANQ